MTSIVAFVAATAATHAQITISNFKTSQTSAGGVSSFSGDYVNGLYVSSQAPSGFLSSSTFASTSGVVTGGDPFGRSIAGQAVFESHTGTVVAPKVTLSSTSGGTSTIQSLTGGYGLVPVMSGDSLSTGNGASAFGFGSSNSYQNVQIVTAPGVSASNVTATIDNVAYSGNTLSFTANFNATAERPLVDFSYTGIGGKTDSGMNGYAPASPFEDDLNFSGAIFVDSPAPQYVSTLSTDVTFGPGDTTTQYEMRTGGTFDANASGLSPGQTVSILLDGNFLWTPRAADGAALDPVEFGEVNETVDYQIPGAVPEPNPVVAIALGIVGFVALQALRRQSS